MRYYTDLHSHSRYARGCSRNLTLAALAQGCLEKGIGIIGTGDYLHPKWHADLKEQLEEVEGQDGLYRLKKEHTTHPDQQNIRFLATVEIATSIIPPGGSKRVHHLLYSPSLEVATQLYDLFASKQYERNLKADGRPVFARCSPAMLAEWVKQASPQTEIVSAHAWTPWFGVLGSRGGYDSLKEAYEDYAPKVLGIETGMSSTPEMNWRIPELDDYAIVSGSDLHSAHPWRLGREACCFEFDREPTFAMVMDAMRKRDPKVFVHTIETDPGYGKYHFDGHRACGVSMPPQEAAKLGGRCPVCKKPLTIGVLARVDELAKRPEGYRPKHAIPFYTLLPLHELLSSSLQVPLTSQKVKREYLKLAEAFGSELRILLEIPVEQLKGVTHERIAQAILLNREGRLQVKPGFDGEYGVAQLPAEMIIGEPKAPRKEKEKKETQAPIQQTL